jgi:hypothetical protein
LVAHIRLAWLHLARSCGDTLDAGALSDAIPTSAVKIRYLAARRRERDLRREPPCGGPISCRGRPQTIDRNQAADRPDRRAEHCHARRAAHPPTSRRGQR